MLVVILARYVQHFMLPHTINGSCKVDEIDRIDALATAEGTTLDSFKHATLRKMDLRLIPMLSLLYLLSFLDRGNIGNAKVAGMNDDLSLTGSQYNLALTVFFFPYAVFEIPSNMMLKIIRPSIWYVTNWPSRYSWRYI